MIAGHPIAGAPLSGSGETTVIYAPVSRIMAGGGINSRPAELVELGVDLLWDNGDLIVWDNDENIGWEA